MVNVKVYSTPTCPWCTKAKAFLDEHKIKYTDVDVSSNEKAQKEMLEKTDGQAGVPVIDIDGTIIQGFDVEALKEALKIE